MTFVFDTIKLNAYPWSGSVAPVSLPIWGAQPTDSYILKSVDGLGPPEVVLSTAPVFPDGGMYVGRRPQNRQIVMRLGLNPNYAIGQTPGDLRNALYAMLNNAGGYLGQGYSPQTNLVFINFWLGTSQVGFVQAFVSRFEVSPFTKDPEVQITFEAMTPYLTGLTAVSQTPTAKDSFTLQNNGTASTGFQMGLTFTATVASGWTLTRVNSSGVNKVFKINRGFVNGDRIQFCTETANRWAFFYPAGGGAMIDLLPYLDSTTEWVMLPPGVSSWMTNNANFNWDVPAVYYDTMYWGI